MRQKDHHLFYTYTNMKTRCNNPNYAFYRDYGGRGIKVCQRWEESFWNFVEDMGDRPDGRTLDRIDNDKGYSPDNCRWATLSEQQQNARPAFYPKAKGYVKTRNGRYEAKICVDSKIVYLGTYDCPLMARLAYVDAAKEKYGSRYQPELRTAV